MDSVVDLRTRVLLSLQRALLGAVFPSLRGVTVEWDERNVHIICYLHGPAAASEVATLSCVETEVIADLPDHKVRLDAVRCDAPAKMSSLGKPLMEF